MQPILEGDAPDLYQRIDNDARKGMVDYFLEERIQEYNDLEFDKDEQNLTTMMWATQKRQQNAEVLPFYFQGGSL